jgi:perosamine synthetase
MKRVAEILAKRQKVAEMYVARLSDDKRFRLQKILPECSKSWFVMVVRLNDNYREADRDRIINTLRSKGIMASNYFPSVHLQPFYVEQLGCKRGMLPICEALCDRTIALPFHGQLTEAEVDQVCQSFFSLL